jgi:hypothetical protein
MTIDFNNPGLVEIENQGYPLAVAPPPVVTSPAASAGVIVQGGTYSPLSPNVIDTTANNVITQPGPQYASTINVSV